MERVQQKDISMIYPSIFDRLPQAWKDFLEFPPDKIDFYNKSFNTLSSYINNCYSAKTDKIYPKYEDLFACFSLHPKDVKCIIIGQDPYHGKNQANGLCFSVNPKMTVPPSLKNIFTELKNDLGCPSPDHGNLSSWKNNGVLLLNTILTVEAGTPGAHKNKGWEIFTDAVIRSLSLKRSNLVFILWGNIAKNIASTINQNKHYVICSPHPSPYSAFSGFFGSKPFSKCNTYLIANNIKPIDWEIK